MLDQTSQININTKIYSSKHTKCIFSEDIVENSVCHELECVLTSACTRLGIQHLELRLTLIELLVVTFLQRNACMSLVYCNRQLVPNALHLYIHHRQYTRPCAKAESSGVQCDAIIHCMITHVVSICHKFITHFFDRHYSAQWHLWQTSAYKVSVLFIYFI